MANRRRKRQTDVNPGGVQATESAQMSTFETEAAARRAVPDHELNVFGASNGSRFFDIGDPSNGPFAVIRQVSAYDAFTGGFSSTQEDGISVGDTTAATDVELSPTEALYPITEFAKQTEKSLWPVMVDLFSSGTGSRYTAVSYSEWVRYNAMLAEAFERLYTVLLINHITYKMDWTAVFPFREEVPTYWYKLARQMDATSVGLASKWLPLMKRMERLIAFPRMIEEIKRVLNPCYSVDFNGRLQVPMFDNPVTATGASTFDRVDKLLSYIEVELANAGALFSTFLPFPMILSNPWHIDRVPEIDINKDSGMFNSPVQRFFTFNDTGDPSVNDCPLVIVNESKEPGDEGYDLQNLLYFTRHTQATWAEVKLATVYLRHDRIADNTFELLTPHAWHNAWLLDDLGAYLRYTGGGSDPADNQWRYDNFITSRFTYNDVDFGHMSPGYMGAWINRDALVRMVRLESDFVFSATTMRTILNVSSGASLRELRTYIAQSVFQAEARRDA